ncbi:uncharacterized protein CELE_F42A9.3 [Caenorhabditis elegans]|uniref:Transmembrane protein n=1 Tax=Caenorhabditis elegans TaxID=6239 RepID=Q20316_CAEEL|nr:Transmembrane protein [Caenorhabditis elegans]CCD67657.1 Transmembrane protein [Caenorhabditis elegans]|eukprot:NP_501473.1 Uncharacterized protein CELE_F42A9.3 [Caenorhabditis elegans]
MATSSASNKAAGPSALGISGPGVSAQNTATGGKVGETSEVTTQMFQASTYGAVKAPKIVADAQQGTNRSSETLENKMVHDFMCGLGGVVGAILFSGIFFFFGVASMRDKVYFLEIPDIVQMFGIPSTVQNASSSG